MTTEEKNAAFWALPPAQQRVAVAKDVLEQLAAKKYRAKSGVYLKLGKRAEAVAKESPSMDLQALLPQLGTCAVCARGALFLSIVRQGDGCTVEDTFDDWWDCLELDEITRDEVSMKVFDIEVLREMEQYFDLTGHEWPRGMRQLSAETRLRNVMQAVIDHDGDFKLSYVADMENIE